jgi:hypothetical protein
MLNWSNDERLSGRESTPFDRVCPSTAFKVSSIYARTLDSRVDTSPAAPHHEPLQG